MSDEIFDILRAAVTFARDGMIQTVPKLRARLLRAYPGKGAEIDAALQTWAAQARRTG